MTIIKNTIIIKSNLLWIQMANKQHKSKAMVLPTVPRQLKFISILYSWLKRKREERKLLKGKLERPFSDLSSEASPLPRTCKRDRETGSASQYIRCQECSLPLRRMDLLLESPSEFEQSKVGELYKKNTVNVNNRTIKRPYDCTVRSTE